MNVRIGGFKKILPNLPWGKSKVDKCDFGGDFWSVMRIWQLSCDVELEVIMVWDHSITKLNHCATLLFESLKLANKNGINVKVQLHDY